MPDETPTTPAEEPSVEEDANAGDGGAAAKWRLLAVILAVVLVASLVAGVLLWRDLQGQVDAAEDEKAAETAAEEAAVNAMTQMTTYNHKTVDEDYAWVEEIGTADFEEAWKPARENAIELIKGFKARAEGTVINSAAEWVGEDEVRVLLFTDQELFERGREGSALEETRVEMTMVRRDGDWLVDTAEVENFFANEPGSPGEAPGSPGQDPESPGQDSGSQ